MEERYDYVIIGAGASGLSMADRFCDPYFADKKILIFDIEKKSVNDRTWCNWVDKDDRYSSLVTRSWNKIAVNQISTDKLLNKNIGPYQYRMLRSKDFYDHVFQKIESSNHVNFICDKYISHEKLDDELVVVTLLNNKVKCKHLFISSGFNIPANKSHYVSQHFKGWFIKSDHSFFDGETAVLMDFRVDQFDDTRFFYVLPLSDKHALVEVALFSNNILTQDEYNAILKKYIENVLKLKQYTIEEEEYGIIPMTTFDFGKLDSPLVTHIGTMAGCVKPSTGYAFTRIQKHCDAIIACIKKGENPHKAQNIFSKFYRIMDATMLNVLLSGKVSGKNFFMQLFHRNSPQVIFNFLEEKSSFIELLSIVNLPFKWIFVRSLVKQLLHRD